MLNGKRSSVGRSGGERSCLVRMTNASEIERRERKNVIRCTGVEEKAANRMLARSNVTEGDGTVQRLSQNGVGRRRVYEGGRKLDLWRCTKVQ